YAFNAAVARWAAPDPIVSISAGYDSRTILSSLLKQGFRPHLAVMGFEGSTDVVVSRQIAESLGLTLSQVELAPEDYLEHGHVISTLTNGTKSAEHWHSFVFPSKSGLDSHHPYFLGANWEF